MYAVAQNFDINMQQPIITGVFGLAFNGKDKYLLTLRNDPDDIRAHRKWQIPGGGMEYGEAAEVTVVRELQEEIKCTPIILDPRPVIKLSMWPNDTAGVASHHITLITYLVSVGEQIPQETEESLECKWFTLEDIQNLDTLPQVKEIIQELASINEA